LKKHPAVTDFRHEGGSGGGWGATVVDLKRD
jgi:dsDNA-specific endonuclease/ATPase MutS2